VPLSIHDLLKAVHDRGASDLHLKVGRPPMLRLHGELLPFAEGQAPLEIDDVMGHVFAMINSNQRAALERDRELDFSFFLRGVARFRGNAFYQKGAVGAVFRLIPAQVPTSTNWDCRPC
jgi:twitching motility protein PilT